MPEESAVTTPVEEFTDATAAFADDQEPPGVALLSVRDPPIQMLPAPVMAPGPGVTLMNVVVKQLPIEYVTTAEPTDTPVTTPDELIVATVVGVIAHVPPGVVLVSVVLAPTHTVLFPEIAAGAAVTVTTRVARQPP